MKYSILAKRNAPNPLSQNAYNFRSKEIDPYSWPFDSHSIIVAVCFNWIWIGETLTYRGYLIFSHTHFGMQPMFVLICFAWQNINLTEVDSFSHVLAFPSHCSVTHQCAAVGKMVRIKSYYVTIDHIKWEKFDQLTVFFLSNDKSFGISSVAFKVNENQVVGDRDEGNNIFGIFLFLFEFFCYRWPWNDLGRFFAVLRVSL